MKSQFFDEICPFCGAGDEFTRHVDRDVQQHSHSATEYRLLSCSACGYEREITRVGNARWTSTRPWTTTADKEHMPDEYCLVLCSECDDVLGRAEIGDAVEIYPERHQSDCCSVPVEIAYTFVDVPEHDSFDTDVDYYQIALRQLKPHLHDEVAAQVWRPLSTFTSEAEGVEFRVGKGMVELRDTDGEHRTFTTSSAEAVIKKLSRNPGMERAEDDGDY